MKSKVIVTGPKSMIGQALMYELVNDKNLDVYPIYHDVTDLMDFEQTLYAFRQIQPDQVYHLAGFNGGISFNKENPDTIFSRTVQMGLNVLKCSQRLGVSKVLSILASCSYPDLGDKVLSECDLWDGLPNPTVECHGLAKRFLHAYSKQINKVSKTQCLSVVMTNAFGPGDNYDVKKTKVVGAMFKKFHQAKINEDSEVECWGTGAPLRELIFSYDSGSLLKKLMEAEWSYDLINLGTPNEITIKDLAEKIASVVGYEGKIVWDITKPDGQMRKKLDLTLLEKVVPNFQYTDFDTALKTTYEEDVEKMV